jgi:hypothetical protein
MPNPEPKDTTAPASFNSDRLPQAPYHPVLTGQPVCRDVRNYADYGHSKGPAGR